MIELKIQRRKYSREKKRYKEGIINTSIYYQKVHMMFTKKKKKKKFHIVRNTTVGTEK